MMAAMRLASPRLDLVAATPALVSAELAGHDDLGRALGAEVPASWPPELYDRGAAEQALKQLVAGGPDEVGWGLWYLVRRGDRAGGGGRPVAIGICGFKGQPMDDGTVEIGYSVTPEHQRQGYASEAVRTLLEWAFSWPTVMRVIAETYPELEPSIRVLERSGFRHTGDGSGERIIRYELQRADFVAAD